MLRSLRRLTSARHEENSRNWSKLTQTACYVNFFSRISKNRANFEKPIRYLKSTYDTASEKCGERDKKKIKGGTVLFRTLTSQKSVNIDYRTHCCYLSDSSGNNSSRSGRQMTALDANVTASVASARKLSAKLKNVQQDALPVYVRLSETIR